MNDLLTLEEKLGVEVSDYALLGTALTHRSYLNENLAVTEDNERLEFLGDAVIDLIVADYLYQTYPEMAEGEMTALRSALVRAETLADFARQLDIPSVLRVGYGEGESGGRERTATLCATFEAVMGAVYLDAGLEATRTAVLRLVQPTLTIIIEGALHKDARSEFQIWGQAQFNITPRYVVASVEGPDHAREFVLEVRLDKQVWGHGRGRSKQTAAQAAATEALKLVDIIESGLPPNFRSETNG